MKLILYIFTLLVISYPLLGQVTEAIVEQVGFSAKTSSGYINDVLIEQKNGSSNHILLNQQNYSSWNKARAQQWGSDNQIKIYQSSGRHNSAEIEQEGDGNCVAGAGLEFSYAYKGLDAVIEADGSSLQTSILGSNNLKIKQHGGGNQIGLTQITLLGNNTADIIQNGDDYCAVFQLNMYDNNYANKAEIKQRGNDRCSVNMINYSAIEPGVEYANLATVEQNGNNNCEITMINNNSYLGNSISVIQPENGPELRIRHTR